jgi:hypothetical protein
MDLTGFIRGVAFFVRKLKIAGDVCDSQYGRAEVAALADQAQQEHQKSPMLERVDISFEVTSDQDDEGW